MDDRGRTRPGTRATREYRSSRVIGGRDPRPYPPFGALTMSLALSFCHRFPILVEPTFSSSRLAAKASLPHGFFPRLAFPLFLSHSPSSPLFLSIEKERGNFCVQREREKRRQTEDDAALYLSISGDRSVRGLDLRLGGCRQKCGLVYRGLVHGSADLVTVSGNKPRDIYGTTPASGTRLVEMRRSWVGG